VYLEAHKNSLVEAYGFDNNYEKVLLKGVGVASDPYEMVVAGDRLYAFGNSTVQQIDISTPEVPLLGPATMAPFPIYDAEPLGGRLYGVGDGGIAIYDISGDAPVFEKQGGMPGDLIAVGAGSIAVTGGDGIHLYKLDDSIPTAVVEPNTELPTEYSLSQNYPNPFNLETVISYSLERRSDVRLSVYNILGRRVSVLVDRPQAAGTYRVFWDGRASTGEVVASGVYFYRLEADHFVRTRKMVLLK
jgi:hypothetical protein